MDDKRDEFICFYPILHPISFYPDFGSCNKPDLEKRLTEYGEA